MAAVLGVDVELEPADVHTTSACDGAPTDFRSKEMVLFTDLDGYVDHVRQLIDQRPADETVIETLREISRTSSDRETFDLELENLRAKLTESSAELRAHVVIRREQVALDLADLTRSRLRCLNGYLMQETLVYE